MSSGRVITLSLACAEHRANNCGPIVLHGFLTHFRKLNICSSPVNKPDGIYSNSRLLILYCDFNGMSCLRKYLFHKLCEVVSSAS